MMFGWKLVRKQTFNDLSSIGKGAIELIKQRDQTICEMADTIHDMDQLIYSMSQCTSWEQMRPIFNALQLGQESRQQQESDRIGTILREELINVYTKPR